MILRIAITTGCLLTPALSFAASCDCTHFPIQPSACFKPCQSALLLKTNKEELLKQLKLDQKTTDILIEKRNSSPDGDLQSLLPKETYSTAMKGAAQLSEKQTAVLGEKYNLKDVEAAPKKTVQTARPLTF